MRRTAIRTSTLTQPGRRAAMVVVRLALWALVAFHALLFVRRIGDASLADPVIALRWLGAASLLVAGWLHRRRGGSLVAGRGALAFWLAVFLLHAFALAPGAAPIVDTAAPVPALGLLLAAVLALTNGLFTTPRRPSDRTCESGRPIRTLDRIARCWARPPPVSLSA